MGTLGTTMLQDRRLLRLVAVAALIRLVVMAVSDGSNDVFIWAEIATRVQERGLMGTYEAMGKANHPPLPIWYMTGALAAYETFGFPFAWLVKIPALAGDALTAVLIWRVVAGRKGVVAARRATLVYLFNPLTVLLVAYHGNTDALYAALAFAAVVALEERRLGLAGVMLGAALNVKLIPVVFGAAFGVLLWRRGGVGRFVAGATAAVLPVITVIAMAPGTLIDRMVRYQTATVEPWGLTGLELAVTGTASPWYHTHGRVVLAVGLLAAAWLAHRRRLDGYRAVGMAAVVFLVLAPGFGVQYLAVAVPFLFAVDLRVATWYCTAAGTFAAAAYASALTWDLPVTTMFREPLSWPVAVFGAVPFAVCIWVATRLAQTEGARPDDGGSSLRPQATEVAGPHRLIERVRIRPDPRLREPV